jgi:nucleoside triphosphatase
MAEPAGKPMMKTRTIVCPIIRNQSDEYLLCKMPTTRGVFPGQWALPGGGMELGEQITEALLREVREELGEELVLTDIQPWSFRDDRRIKKYPEGSEEEIYMIYLIFDCLALNQNIRINDEFEAYAWVKKSELASYDLNEATRLTFEKKGMLE